MKKLFLTSLFALVAALAMAVPVQRGQWKTITLADGSMVRVEAAGDELCHFWRSEAGDAYVKQNNVFVKADVHALNEAVAAERDMLNELRMSRFQKYFGHEFGAVADGKKKIPALKRLEGVKKGLVMLVEFADIHFTEGHTSEFYRHVLNEGGPAEMGYQGSVKQYFLDQSNDKFTVDFDVSSIIRMPKAHNSYTNDVRAMVRAAIDELKDDPSYDWAQYDWDEDGEIDMVFVVYAGYGQNQKSDDATLIWPHMSAIGSNLPVVAGKKVNTYACSNEINWNWGEGDKDNGIGTFCHEFAHCLGYPDLYDVCYNCKPKGITAMDRWDLMDEGCYNSDNFCPISFSIYERMTAGWITPEELKIGKEYKNLRPISDKDGGDSYILTNPNNENELYVFEPIQNEGWASGMYRSKGLLVLHIDYSSSLWTRNLVNCAQSPTVNSTSRYTYVPANGVFYPESSSQIKGSLYPYKEVDSLELIWNTGDSKGNRVCPLKLTNIVVNEDNTVSFTTEENEDAVFPEGTFYYESFRSCRGTGGNDNLWEDVATSYFVPDNNWTSSTGTGANKCAMIGTEAQPGLATTDDIKLEPGEYVLTFKAGRYSNEVPQITLLDPTNTTTSFSQTSFDLAVGKWTDCETKITVGEKANIRFRSSTKGRWFLDEVMIRKPGASAIDAVCSGQDANNGSKNIFNLNGQKVGADYRGIVVKNGKKYLSK